MHALTTWEQTGVFDPYNPNQIIREPNNIGIPGGAYASFYFNKVPTKTQQVLGGLGDFSDLPIWAQVTIVGGLAATLGYFGVKWVGARAKPARR